MLKVFFLLMALGALTLGAAEKPVYEQNFDEEVPGRVPNNWKVRWGQPGNDTFLVSSRQAASGDNALELHHHSDTPMFGIGVELGNVVSNGTLRVAYKLRLAPGTDLGFEVRDSERKVSVARWNFSRAVFMSASTKPGAKGGRIWIGGTRSDEWYSVEILLPVGKDKGEMIRYSITDMAGKTSSAEVEYCRTDKPLQYFYVNFPPAGGAETVVYLDDLMITHVE